MLLKSVQFVNFKNYKDLEIEFCDGINAFVGNNGSGKTTILDAIYFLSMCKSYLNRIDRQNIQFDAPFFTLFGDWELKDKIYREQLTVKVGAKKIVKINKKELEKLSDHIGTFPVVFISPYDTDLIQEGSQFRRKWMDGILVQLDKSYLENLLRYQKVLEQRNALLKNMHSQRLFEPESVEIWNEQLIPLGEEIFAHRKVFFEEFSPFFNDYYSRLSNDQEIVNIEYVSQMADGNYKNLLQNSIRKDLHTQYTNFGVHKDDLVFTINDHPIKKFGSQGQQKSFLIALRMAQFEWLKKHKGIKPVLLLDDIFDKLDSTRVKKLVTMVSDNYFGQVFITDTDADRMQTLLENLSGRKKLFKIVEESCVTLQEYE